MSDTTDVPTVPAPDAESAAKPAKKRARNAAAVAPVPGASGGTAAPEAAPAEEEAPAQFAKIRIVRTGVKAKGFTFAARAIVSGVPLQHAEYLKRNGEAEILEVS